MNMNFPSSWGRHRARDIPKLQPYAPADNHTQSLTSITGITTTADISPYQNTFTLLLFTGKNPKPTIKLLFNTPTAIQ